MCINLLQFCFVLFYYKMSIQSRRSYYTYLVLYFTTYYFTSWFYSRECVVFYCYWSLLLYFIWLVRNDEIKMFNQHKRIVNLSKHTGRTQCKRSSRLCSSPVWSSTTRGLWNSLTRGAKRLASVCDSRQKHWPQHENTTHITGIQQVQFMYKHHSQTMHTFCGQDNCCVQGYRQIIVEQP